jgi:hypothetical protein
MFHGVIALVVEQDSYKIRYAVAKNQKLWHFLTETVMLIPGAEILKVLIFDLLFLTIPVCIFSKQPFYL